MLVSLLGDLTNSMNRVKIIIKLIHFRQSFQYLEMGHHFYLVLHCIIGQWNLLNSLNHKEFYLPIIGIDIYNLLILVDHMKVKHVIMDLLGRQLKTRVFKI